MRRHAATGKRFLSTVFLGSVTTLLLTGCVTLGKPIATRMEYDINQLAYSSLPLKTAKVGKGLILKGGASEISYREVSPGLALVEGDILLDINQESEAPALTQVSCVPSGGGNNRIPCRWNEGYIPYTIDSSLSADKAAEVQRAIDEIWNAASGVPLRPRSAEVDFVTFARGNTCSSKVGKQGGQQFVSVGEACMAGNIAHEIGHAFGLYHEHQRADRNDFIRVNIAAARPTNRSDFSLVGASLIYFQRDIDWDSIMLYDSYAFALEENVPVMIRISTNAPFTAQRERLSVLDRLGIELVRVNYQCKTINCDEVYPPRVSK